MSDTKDERGEPKLSPELRRAIAADTIGCFVDNAVLKKADVAVLKKILAADLDVVSGTPISRKRALGALARSDKSEETGALLARVLADRKRPARERAAAAAYLGLLGPALAEKPLLAALRAAQGEDEPLLRVEVIKALGEAGSKEALAALREIPPSDDDPAKRQLVLARIAVAIREQADGADVETLERDLQLRWITTEAKPLDAKAVRETQNAIGGSTFGVALNPEVGFAFDCGATQNVLFLNEDLKSGGFAQGLSRRPMIAGLVVSKAEDLQYFTLRWLLLTSPAKQGVRMILVRPTGEPAFEGLAVTGDAKALRFTLRDTAGERVSAAIDGEIADDAIRWSLRVRQEPPRGKLRPRPITGAERIGPRARDPVTSG